MEIDQEQTILENIEKVRNRIREAAARSGRADNEIELIAVTKQKPAAVVKTLAENGVKKIGESYLNEAVFKIDLLEGLDIEWHMIGNIQRGKEKSIAHKFQVVHSVGRLKTAQELNKQAVLQERKLPVYLELNISGESTKHGWKASRDEELEVLVPDFAEIMEFPNLEILGLMTMAPYSVDPEDSRPYFKRMREIRQKLSVSVPQGKFAGLSMGMSGDFEVAIEEGATVVRIGSALVGAR